MIIKITAIPKQDEAGNVIIDKTGKDVVYDRERAFVVSKDGRYKRVVTLTDEMAAEIIKGHQYFNAVEKNGTLHITGAVAARF